MMTIVMTASITMPPTHSYHYSPAAACTRVGSWAK